MFGIDVQPVDVAPVHREEASDLAVPHEDRHLTACEDRRPEERAILGQRPALFERKERIRIALRAMPERYDVVEVGFAEGAGLGGGGWSRSHERSRLRLEDSAVACALRGLVRIALR